MFTTAAPLAVNAGQKQELAALVRNGNSSQKIALRCRLFASRSSGSRQSGYCPTTGRIAAYHFGATRRIRQARNDGGYGSSQAETSRQSSDGGSGAEDPRYNLENAPGR